MRPRVEGRDLGAEVVDHDEDGGRPHLVQGSGFRVQCAMLRVEG